MTVLKNKWFWLLLVVALLPLWDLLKPGLFVAHDSTDHVARIANFFVNLQEGTLIPRWAGKLNWGYGHPILMFLYPLPSYVASLFHFTGLSLVSAVELVFALGFVGSGLTMFLWLREMLDDQAAFLGAIFYLLAPYRFVDLYVRGAIGENFFFIWPPLVLYFLLRMSRQSKSVYGIGAALGVAAMLLSHNALSLMFLPFLFFYALWLALGLKKKRRLFLLQSLLVFLNGFLLAAFFWLPAFAEGKYTLRDIVTQGDWHNRFESFSRLLYSPWSYGGTGELSVQVGLLQWLAVFLSPWLLYQLRKSRDRLFQLILWLELFFLVAIFLMLPGALFLYEKVTLLQKFQFPWRWLSLAIFPPAVFIAVAVKRLSSPWKTGLVILLSFTAVALSFNFWRAKAQVVRDDSFYSGIYAGTTDTGESAPIWSVRFMLQEPKAFLEVIEGKGTLETVSRTTREHLYKVNILSPEARLLENTLYFPGWFVEVDGESLPVQFQDPTYRGLMTFMVPAGEHALKIVFRETRLRQFADCLSLGGLFLLGLWFLLRKAIMKL